MKIANKHVYSFIKRVSSMGDYYPEMLGSMFIINCPFFFTGLWAMVKGFVDPATRSKIKILGGSF